MHKLCIIYFVTFLCDQPYIQYIAECDTIYALLRPISNYYITAYAWVWGVKFDTYEVQV